MNIYLDIETLPSDSQELREAIGKTIKPPAQYKKPESIDEWLRENKEAAINEAMAKTSLDGMYGRIACLCYAVDDGEVVAIYDDDEKVLLRNFKDHMVDATGMNGSNAVFVGHNIVGFDLPFIKHRSIIQNIFPDFTVMNAIRSKSWDGAVADTMLMWSSDREKRVSLDKLCKALGIPGKGDFDGSMVADTWPVDPQKVIDYCKDDVERTRAVYKRLTFAA